MLPKFFSVLWFIAISFAGAVHGQSSVAMDSIKLLLEKATSDRQKAELLYQRGDELSVSDTVQSVSFIRHGLDYTAEDPFQRGVGYFYLGRVYMDFAPTRAEASFDTAIHYLKQISTAESDIYQSRTWANKAVMAQLRGDNRRYIDLFLRAVIPLAAKGGDSLRVADGYTNVALPFMNYGEYDKAILYLKRSVAIFERLAPEDLRKVDVYCYLAKTYLLQGKLDEAGVNISSASEALKKDPESLYAPIFHAVESMYLIKLEKWNEARQTIDNGLHIAEKLKNRYDIRTLLYQKSELFKAQQHWEQAKAVLLDMYHGGYIELITDKRQLFSDLANIEEQLGNHKQAYRWMLEHRDVSDKMYAEETKAKIADLEARYNYVQKEKELILAREKTNQQRAIVWITMISFVFVLIFFYFWFRSRKLRTTREFQHLKQQQRIELGKALLEGEERERSRLARDLHDGLGGMLAGIKLNLSQMIGAKKHLGPDDLVQTVDRLGYSVNELRRISRNMMPESLLQSGLEVALKDLCDEATLPGLKVSFRAFDLDEDFAPQVKVMIYRIIQELIYNAIKHAEASKVTVQCSQSDNFFFVTVEDNGKGFAEKAIPNTSRGLKNIQNRVDMLNGNMDIETSSEGTDINIELYVGP